MEFLLFSIAPPARADAFLPLLLDAISPFGAWHRPFSSLPCSGGGLACFLCEGVRMIVPKRVQKTWSFFEPPLR